MNKNEANFTSDEIKKLEGMTILDLAQEISHATSNDLVSGDTNVFEFIKKYVVY